VFTFFIILYEFNSNNFFGSDAVSYLYNKQMLVGSLVGWLVGDHLLLRDFGLYWIIFTTMCVY
jgi:hypothetical protein